LIISPECGIVTADEMEQPAFEWVYMVADLMDSYFTNRHVFDIPADVDVTVEVIKMRHVILPNILKALRIMEREKHNHNKTASHVFMFLLNCLINFFC
jgi:hypothetical protein